MFQLDSATRPRIPNLAGVSIKLSDLDLNFFAYSSDVKSVSIYADVICAARAETSFKRSSERSFRMTVRI